MAINTTIPCNCVVREALEEQRDVLERHYQHKIKQMEKKFERQKEDFRATLVQDLKEYKEQLPLSHTPIANTGSWRNDRDGWAGSSANALPMNTSTPDRARKWSRDRIGIEVQSSRSVSPFSTTASLEKNRPTCSPLPHTIKQTDRDEENSNNVGIFDMDSELPESPPVARWSYPIISSDDQDNLESNQLERESDEEECIDKELESYVNLTPHQLLQLSIESTGSIKERRSRSVAFSAGSPYTIEGRRTESIHNLTCYTSSPLKVKVLNYSLRGTRISPYYVYEVQLKIDKEVWKVYRSYYQFKQFHEELTRKFSELSKHHFPSCKKFGIKDKKFLDQRRSELQGYMQSLFSLLPTVRSCSLYDHGSRHLSKEKLISFHSFFNDSLTH